MNEIDRFNPRVLHISYSKYPPMGVIEQLKSEISAAKKLGIPWDTVLIGAGECDQPFYIRQRKTLPGPLRWFFVYIWLIGRQKYYDLILMRCIKADFVGWLMVPFIKNIMFVHHTKEIEECSGVSPPWYGFFLSQIEKIFGRLKLKKTVGVAAVTKEIANYELDRIGVYKNAIVIPNGISVEDSIVLEDNRKADFSAIYIASKFENWHGLDLLLSSFDKNPNCDLNLHLVGKVSDSDLAIVQKINKVKPRIFVHGALSKVKISELMSNCDLGLGSFALHRNKLTEACTLKTREYLACGLPVYANHEDSGLPEDFKFFKKGEPNIQKIYESAGEFRQIAREEVAESAHRYIDKTTIMAKVYAELKTFKM